MKVQTQEGRVFEGTVLQVVQQMRSLTFAPGQPVREYVEGVATRVSMADGVSVKPTGETDEQLAASLIDQLAAAGIIKVS